MDGAYLETDAEMRTLLGRLSAALCNLDAELPHSCRVSDDSPLALTRRVVQSALDAMDGVCRHFASMSALARDHVRHDPDLRELNVYLHHLKQSTGKDGGPRPRHLRADDDAAAARILRRIARRYRASSLAALGDRDDLLLLLTKATCARYRRCFAAAYAHDTKPFLDRLFRDHMLSGLPNTLLQITQEIVDKGDYEYLLGILRGGLPYCMLFELLGWPRDRIRYVGIGRKNVAFSLDPALLRWSYTDDLRCLKRRRVLLVDNIIVTGGTLKRVADVLSPLTPQLLGLFVERMEDLSHLGLRDKELAVKRMRSCLNAVHICTERPDLRSLDVGRARSTLRSNLNALGIRVGS